MEYRKLGNSGLDVRHRQVSGLILGEGVLNELFEREPALGMQLLRNIISNLSAKLAATDQTLAARLAHQSRR